MERSENRMMKVTTKSIVGSILVCTLALVITLGYIRVKPRRVESAEAINTYSGDGVAHYLDAPLFGIDGVLIDMPAFNMMDGLNTEYDLTGIPAGRPYGIFLLVPLDVERDSQVRDTLLKGEWSYTIRKNGAAVRTVSGLLGEMDNSGCYERVKGKDGKEQMVHINEFLKYPKHRLEIPDAKDKWSLSVTFSNTALQEPISAHIRLRRGGGK